MASSNSVTSGFVDLATFDSIEGKMYGGSDSYTPFVKAHRKSTWFTQVPVVLSTASGQGDFGTEYHVNVSRAGDYLLHNWLEVTLPQITAADQGGATNIRAFWVKNIGHNLIEQVSVRFNDLEAAKFDSSQLDMWAALTVPEGKMNGYKKMVGYGVSTTAADGRSQVFLRGLDASAKAHTINIPLPFFYTRDAGVSLPTAALPYNDIKIHIKFRKFEDLIVYAKDTTTTPVQIANTVVTATTPASPKLSNVRLWANYAIVSNEERKLMGTAARDILIEQVQQQPLQTFDTSQTKVYDVRFSHAVKALMFGIRNEPVRDVAPSDATRIPCLLGGVLGDKFSNYAEVKHAEEKEALTQLGFDRSAPFDDVSLLYENTSRLGDVPAAYFTDINPYYHASRIPTDEPGIALYSFAHDLIDLHPGGSTNFGRLTNVSLKPKPSTSFAGQFSAATPTSKNAQIVVNAVNHNVIRVSGGALGFPHL